MTISKHTLLRLAASAAFVIALVTACSQDNMLLSYQHTVQVGLYSKSTHDDTTLTVVSVQGVGVDSLLYDEEDELGELFLNMNLHTDTTQFVVMTQTLQDDLYFKYQVQLEPASSGSGMAVRIHIDSISHTTTFIDSVAIVNADVVYNESLENVQIFVY